MIAGCGFIKPSRVQLWNQAADYLSDQTRAQTDLQHLFSAFLSAPIAIFAPKLRYGGNARAKLSCVCACAGEMRSEPEH